MNRFKITILVAALSLIIPGALQAQENDRFGGWEFFEVNHEFGNGPFFAKFYFEFDNYGFNRMECWYTRTSFGLKLFPWLKANLAYDYLRYPSFTTHKAVFDVIGTLKQGGLTVSIRERYMHDWTPSLGTQGDVLRSRLKVQYSIPETRFSPYLAVEVFTWGDVWKKTRHYVACDYDLSKSVQLEAYYLYYAFNGLPAEHIIGTGVNFYF